MIWATMPAPAPARPLTTAFDMAGGRGARFLSRCEGCGWREEVGPSAPPWPPH